MRSNKPGLADLKRMTREAEARRTAPRAVPAARPPHGAHKAIESTPTEKTIAAGKVASAGSASARLAPDRPARAPSVAASDVALFRRLVGDVRPVDTRNRLLHTPAPKPLVARRPREQDADMAASRPDQPADSGLSDAGVSHLLCEDGTAFLRPGTGPEILKKIAQRYWRIEADIDLHGMTIDQARLRLADFIVQCVAYEARCVRVVHGQGYGSPDAQPVLRDKVRAWLVGLADVRAFAQAPQRDGGAGATIVLLRADDRRSRDKRA